MFSISKLCVTFFLGIIEGITEFLPISSTSHILLIGYFLNCTDDITKIFTVFMQLGAILSIVLIFWVRLRSMGTICIIKLFMLRKYIIDGNHHLSCWHIFFGTLPGVMVGAVFYANIGMEWDLIYIVYGLITGSIFLLVSELCLLKYNKISNISNIDEITYMQAFLIGCFQCLAFFPGFSRSGATIGAGFLVGLNRNTSLEFSFILAIPIIFSAAAFSIYHYFTYFVNIVSLCIMGFVLSFFTAICTVRSLLKVMSRISLVPFIVYRLLLAVGIYWGLVD